MLPSLLEIRMKIEYQEVVHDRICSLTSLTTGTAYPSALPRQDRPSPSKDNDGILKTPLSSYPLLLCMFARGVIADVGAWAAASPGPRRALGCFLDHLVPSRLPVAKPRAAPLASFQKNFRTEMEAFESIHRRGLEVAPAASDMTVPSTGRSLDRAILAPARHPTETRSLYSMNVAVKGLSRSLSLSLAYGLPSIGFGPVAERQSTFDHEISPAALEQHCPQSEKVDLGESSKHRQTLHPIHDAVP
ncbi:hypothetical protein DTO271G3_8244 [Paecilomyces variotii]|nr:hypothetical protein DTO271G3_8244 [Paecilomyces variotii]